MATKTISVDIEAYERLAAARTSARESFSHVIKRAIWLPEQGTAGRMLELTRALSGENGVLSEEELERLDDAQEKDAVAPDRWIE